MTVSADLRTYALADGTIAGLISDRWHPGVLPENPTLPAVTYTVITAPKPMRSHTSEGPQQWRFQLDSWAETHAEAEELADAIDARFQSLSGAMGSSTVQDATVEDRNDRHEEALDLYRQRADVVLWIE